jgi:cytochrome P450
VDFDSLEAGFDTYSDDVREHWYDAVAFMREKCPVTRSDAHGGVWFISRYEDVHRVLRESKTFSSSRGALLPPGPNGQLPVELDGQRHKDFRKLMNPFLSAAAVQLHEPAIRRVLRTAIDGIASTPSCDFMEAFTRRFPGVIIFTEFLGIDDPAELEECLGYTGGVAYELNSDDGHGKSNGLEDWSYRFIDRRRRAEPRDDILDAFLGAQVDGEILSDEEVMQVLKLFILGGLDTTSDATANALLHLANDPSLQNRLRNDLSLLPAAVEEFLRFDAIVTANSRCVMDDVEIGGTTIQKGSTVAVIHAAANRDPRAFDSPEHIDIDRKRKLNFTFGAGPHLCVGIHLAKLEMRIALEEVLTRLPEFHLDPASIPRYKQGMARGLEQLQVVFGSPNNAGEE